MSIELELKLELDPESARALARHTLFKKSEQQENHQLSVYYDTPTGKLRKNGFSLRVRSTEAGFIQTVKTAETGTGLFARGEWEAPVGSLEPSLKVLKQTRAASIGARKLQPVIRSEVRRTIWRTESDKAALEFSFDQGTVESHGRDAPICEIEIELLKGAPAEAFEAARSLAERIPVRIGVLSKAERGFALADGTLAKPTKASKVPVHIEMDVTDGFASIASSCLRHFRLNEPLIVANRDPVALHQARVAMRRLRSALSLFRPAIIDAQFERMREELRWFTGQLGEARNLDVLLERQLPDRVERTLRGRREAAYRKVIAVLRAKRFRLLMIDLIWWISLGSWRASEKAARPLVLFGSRRVERLWQRIAAHDDLRKMNEVERHDVRIEVKKLRYGLEFLQALHEGAGEKQGHFLNALEAFQETLGHLNDIATARELAIPGVPDVIDPKQEPKLLAKAQRRFRRLKALGPYWS